ncbi:outer membrane beta-barrel protein [Nibribacter ruber]|uniref:Outer membrane beta-barrel protein n=1 Tax=Nibribacter ruber TaxID=2698458 RepID=A0A6P1NU99_9BACT|nr:outer membrane beta-barrel protein [Nibribacter ruber]QHL86620.1 outer membrane beta-barrel protein [Nibribacter ruber]
MKKLVFALCLFLPGLAQAQLSKLQKEVKVTLNQTFTKDELEPNDPSLHQYRFKAKTGGGAEVLLSNYLAGSFFVKGGLGLRFNQFGFTIDQTSSQAQWQGDQSLLTLQVPLLLENRFLEERLRLNYGVTPYVLLYHTEDLKAANAGAKAMEPAFQNTKYNLVGMQLQIGTSFQINRSLGLTLEYNYLFSNLIKEQVAQGTAVLPANLRLHTVSAGVLYRLGSQSGRLRRL